MVRQCTIREQSGHGSQVSKVQFFWAAPSITGKMELGSIPFVADTWVGENACIIPCMPEHVHERRYQPLYTPPINHSIHYQPTLHQGIPSITMTSQQPVLRQTHEVLLHVRRPRCPNLWVKSKPQAPTKIDRSNPKIIYYYLITYVV